MSAWIRRRLPLFPLAALAAVLFVHGRYTWHGVRPPIDGYRTPFAEAGYALRYLAGQTPDRVIASRRNGQLHLFFDGEIQVQRAESGANAGRQLAAAMRPTIDRLTAAGVQVVPVIVPTKLSIYREELPFDLDTRSRWTTAPASGEREDPGRIHQVLAEALPEAIDLYEPFRDFRRAFPDRRLYLPLDYHWSSLGSGVAVLEIARVLARRGLLHTAPEWLSLGARPAEPSTLTDLYPLPRWFLARGREFQQPTEAVRFVTAPVDDTRRVILSGTSFSGGAPHDFLGQLRSVLGRQMEAFARPNNGYAGGFLRMREVGLEFRPGDLVIWEVPLCCYGLDGPRLPAPDTLTIAVPPR